VHSAFWLSSCILSIGIVGASGRVGSALAQTLLDQVEILRERFDIEIKVLGVTNSSRMILSENLNSKLRTCLMSIARKVTPSPSIDTESPTSPPRSSLKSTKSFVSLEELANQSISTINGTNTTVQLIPADLDEFSKYLTSGINPNVVMIDCSNSSTIANLHPQWLKSGAHVITANKLPISGSLELYNDIFEAAKSGNRSYLSEVTIGASVPVLTTLNDILASGDAVHSIVGLMSVSAGLILTGMCDEGLTFSQALAKTHATGIFEDDAFADLEGHEAAQKLLILARSIDFPLTREDIEVQPLAVRREVQSWDDPSKEFEAEDIIMSNRVQAAKSKGCTLRYVQRIECTPAAALGSNESITMKVWFCSVLLSLAYV
jgi:homoserine dehydrogenase